jgi:hypothetical protein
MQILTPSEPEDLRAKKEKIDVKPVHGKKGAVASTGP